MGISTLVLGVGGTGVLAVRAVKRIYAELEESSRTSVAFLAIDFDRSALDRRDEELAELEPKEFLYLDPEGLQVPVRNIDRTYDSRPAWEKIRGWFPDPREVRIPTSEVEANGAGQFRMLGRLGFFVYDSLIEKTLLRAYESLDIDIDSASASRERRVILAASIAGGTGAGMMIDLAYVIRRHLEGRPHVFAYLLLPEVFAEVDQGGRIYQNAYATLRELAHLKDQLIPFKAEYFNVAPIDVPVGGEQPFSRIFLYGRAKRGGWRPSREGGPSSEPRRHQPVLAATLQMAQAILPQLNRELQEKSKSVVANTAASDGSEERHHLQMQCFSTSGGDFIPLGGDARSIDHKRLFYASLGMLSREGLADLYSERARERFDRLSRSEGETGEPDGVGEGRRDNLHASSDREAAARVTVLRDSLRNLAGKHANSVASLLLSKASSISEGARDDSEVSLSLLENAERLRSLVGEQIRTEAEDRLYASLESMGEEVLRSYKAELWEWMDRFVPHTSAPGDSRSLLERWAFTSLLLQLLGEIRVAPAESRNVHLEEIRKAFEEIDRRRGLDSKLPGWSRLVSKSRMELNYALATLALVRSLEVGVIATRINTVLQRQAHQELLGRLDEARRSLEAELNPFLAQRKVIQCMDEALSSEYEPLRYPIHKQLADRLEGVLPELLRELSRSDAGGHEAAEALRARFFRAFEKIVLDGSSLDTLRFDVDLQAIKERIVEGLVGMRQNIFVRRTPSRRRKGIAIASSPNGFSDGGYEIENFLEVNTEQLLLCRCEVIPSDDRLLKIYYEDLFNPPDHLRNIDDYYNAYRSQAHPELFHIDRRFLDHKDFRQITTGTYRLVIHCGNPDCAHNIAGIPFEERVCDGCGRLIRSRCGNSGCREDSLHTSEGSTAKTCPSCGRFNHSAWWKCHQHGKEEVLVPIEKEHCPRCINSHHDDPLGFSLRCVSKRPDLQQAVPCPSCVLMHEVDPRHPIFNVTGELVRFYRDGVNGHDLAKFRSLARGKSGLPDDFRCPNCRAYLIPVHHRGLSKQEDCR